MSRVEFSIKTRLSIETCNEGEELKNDVRGTFFTICEFSEQYFETGAALEITTKIPLKSTERDPK